MDSLARLSPSINRPRFPALTTGHALLMTLIVVAFLMGGSARDDTWSLLILRPLTAMIFIGTLASCLPLVWKQWPEAILVGAAMMLLPLFHLTPLPPALWTTLPGRQIAVDAYGAAGMAPPWRAFSLTPQHSWNAFFFLMAPVSALLLTLRLSPVALGQALFLFLVLGLISALLGYGQILGLPFYVYDITNRGMAVGLFANRNHEAILLACLLPLIALHARMTKGRNGNALFTAVAAILVIPLIFMTGSRAGLIAAAAAMAMALWTYGDCVIIPRRNRRASLKRILLAALFSISCFAGLFFLYSRAPALARLYDASPESEMRWQAAPVIWRAVQDYMPWGSGIGSFVEIYKIYEPDRLLGPNYLNHAHNDVLELILTGGMAAALLLVSTMAVFAHRARAALASAGCNNKGDGRPWARAGVSIFVLLTLASLVDYPLRTPALATLLAFAAACAMRRDLHAPQLDGKASQ